MDELLEALGYPVVTVPAEHCDSRDAAITFLVRVLAGTARLRDGAGPAVTAQLLAREAVGPTVLGNGLALPHLMTVAVDEVVGVVGRTANPISWPGGYDETPVRHLILLLTPASKPLDMLLAEERVVRHLFRSSHACEQAIRLRAYRYWDAAGRPDGGAMNFWLEAERDLAAGR